MASTITMTHQGPSSKPSAPGRSIQDNTSSATLQRAAVPAQLQTAEKEISPVQGKLQSAGQPGPFILQQQPQVIRPIPERFALQGGSGNPVQRMKIDDTFELEDMKRSDSTQQLTVKGQSEAMIYPMNTYKTVVDDTDSYEELVKNEAKEIADIGEEASSSRINPEVEQTTSKKSEFSRKENNPLTSGGRKARSRGTPSLMDVYYKTKTANDYWPFKLRLEGKWDGDDGKGARNIEITFSNSGYGYTTKVEGATGAPYVAKPDEEATGAKDFPMTHAFDESGVVNVSESAKALANKGDADATSKVISEGARWISVRNKAEQGNLKDTTRFYPDGYYPDGFTPPSISFKTLWNSWNAIFGKAWNITEETLIEKLESRKLTESDQPTYAVLKANSSNYAIPRAALQEKTDIDQFLNGPLKDTWAKVTNAIRVNVSHEVQDDQEGHTKIDLYGRFMTIFKEILEQDNEQDVSDEQAEELFDKANFFYTLTHELALHAIPNQGKNLNEAGMFDGSVLDPAAAIKDHNAIVDLSMSYFEETVKPAAQSLANNETTEEPNENFPTCDDFLVEFLGDVETVIGAVRGNYISTTLEREGLPDPNEQYQTPDTVPELKALMRKALLTVEAVKTFCSELSVKKSESDQMADDLKVMLEPILQLEDTADEETVFNAIAAKKTEDDEDDVVSVHDDESISSDTEDTPPPTNAKGKKSKASANMFALLQNDDDL